jgi:hypothetical protein
MKRTYVLPEWRFYDLLMKLGSVTEIAQMLKARGYNPPPRPTIQGWRNRNLMPAKWVPVFIKLAFDLGVIHDIDELKKTKGKQPDLQDPVNIF